MTAEALHALPGAGPGNTPQHGEVPPRTVTNRRQASEPVHGTHPNSE